MSGHSLWVRPIDPRTISDRTRYLRNRWLGYEPKYRVWLWYRMKDFWYYRTYRNSKRKDQQA